MVITGKSETGGHVYMGVYDETRTAFDGLVARPGESQLFPCFRRLPSSFSIISPPLTEFTRRKWCPSHNKPTRWCPAFESTLYPQVNVLRVMYCAMCNRAPSLSVSDAGDPLQFSFHSNHVLSRTICCTCCLLDHLSILNGRRIIHRRNRISSPVSRVSCMINNLYNWI